LSHWAECSQPAAGQARRGALASQTSYDYVQTWSAT
jgi:hypothetical protein